MICTSPFEHVYMFMNSLEHMHSLVEHVQTSICTKKLLVEHVHVHISVEHTCAYICTPSIEHVHTPIEHIHTIHDQSMLSICTHILWLFQSSYGPFEQKRIFSVPNLSYSRGI